ncbi:MAG: hypothetical protein QM811_14260 [Pirellulales bacterium]
MAKALPDEPTKWDVELKIDGVAVSIFYENGVLVRGVTRGNGVVGDDITHNVRVVHDVPKKLNAKHPPAVVELRGEIYMRNADLARINEKRVAAGEEAYANTRNVAAGAIRLLDPKIAKSRDLRFFVHGLGYSEGFAPKSHYEYLEQARKWGFVTTPLVEAPTDFEAAVARCDALIERLHELEFEVDGLVLKVDDYGQRERLGNTTKSPALGRRL